MFHNLYIPTFSVSNVNLQPLGLRYFETQLK